MVLPVVYGIERPADECAILVPMPCPNIIALFIEVGSKGDQVDGIISAALYSPVVRITKSTYSMLNSFSDHLFYYVTG
jgi:hypothetical protein